MSGNKILILTGEASGDLHASGLVRELLSREPGLKIYCVGGKRMQRAGAKVILPSSRLSVVGLFEIFRHAQPILSAFFKVRGWISKERPDLLVLVDFPEFNLLMGRYAKSLCIPVFYYISPQVWAWRQGRVRSIKKVVDRMAVILPFEEEFYRGFGIDAAFVGHPLIDSMNIKEIGRRRLRMELGLGDEGRLVCLLPGSRKGEVERHLPIMIDAAAEMKKRMPGLRFCVALGSGTASSLRKFVEETLAGNPVAISFVEGRTYAAIRAADLCIAASGTVTLEAAIIGTPVVVIYRVSMLSYYVGKGLIKVPWVSLVNLVAQEEVVPELLQNDATPEKIAASSLDILESRQKRKRMLSDFKTVVNMLGEKGAARRTADLVLGLLKDMD